LLGARHARLGSKLSAGTTGNQPKTLLEAPSAGAYHLTHTSANLAGGATEAPSPKLPVQREKSKKCFSSPYRRIIDEIRDDGHPVPAGLPGSGGG
jgi:hypothetical protein